MSADAETAFSTSATSPRPLASIRWVLVLAVVLAAIYLVVALARVPTTGPDTWIYEAWGRTLYESGWDIAAFLKETDFIGGTEALYIASSSVYGLVTAAFGDSWITGYILFNWAAMSATALLMLLSLRRLGLDRTSLLVAALFMGILWEHVYWVSVVYNDISFNLLLAVVFALCTFGLTTPPGRRRQTAWAFAFLVGLFTVAYRPTGLWVVGVLVVAFAAGAYRFPFSNDSIRRPVLRAIAVIVFVGLAGWIGASFVLASTEQLPPSFIKDLVRLVDDMFQDGMIVHARLETYSAPPDGVVDYAAMIGRKFIYYFKFSANDFGGAHNLYNWITFTPFYFLALLGAGALLVAPARMNQALLGAGLLSLIWVLFFALAHAVTVIDFDWRYRLPVYAPLGVLAIIGFGFVRAGVFGVLGRADGPDTPRRLGE